MMADDNEEVDVIDPNDSMIPSFTEFQRGQFIVEKAKDEIVLLLFEKGITSKNAFEGAKKYINGLLEKTLPEEYKKHNDLFRKHFRAKKWETDLFEPLEQAKLEEARFMRKNKIRQFIRKNFNVLKMEFSGQDPTPEKRSTKLPKSAEKDDVSTPDNQTITNSVEKERRVLVKEEDDEDEDTEYEGKVLKELDESTGELVLGNVLGKVNGSYDLDDKAEDEADERRELSETKKVILKKCVNFLSKRLDAYINKGVDINFIAMNDPFVLTSTMVQDVLERVNVNDDVTVDNS